jgi:hypothetical protein
MSKTIEQFNTARVPYLDTDKFGLGYGSFDGTGHPISPWLTYGGTLGDLTTYMKSRIGTDQITSVGDSDHSMLTSDFELVTSTPFTSSRTWNLSVAGASPKGTRKRIVDLAGAIGTYLLAVNPVGTDTLNGVRSPVLLSSRYASVIVESDGVSGWTVVTRTPGLLAANNLSDLQSATTARNNLGLGSAATADVAGLLSANNNLSELSNKSTARSNLQLGTVAVLNSIVYSYIDPSMIATSADIINGTPGKLVPASALGGTSQAPIAIPFSQTGGTWDFNLFVNGIWTIPSTSTSTTITINPTNIKPGQQGFVTIYCQTQTGGASRTVSWPTQFNQITTTVQTTSFTSNSAALFEYWTESPSIVRIRVTTRV